MNSLVSDEIEQYAIEHTSPLPPYLEELTRVTYEKMDAPQMLVGPVEGMLLQFLVWATEARRVLEIGTFTGFSAQIMAAALPEDGVLVTCDILVGPMRHLPRVGVEGVYANADQWAGPVASTRVAERTFRIFDVYCECGSVELGNKPFQ